MVQLPEPGSAEVVYDFPSMLALCGLEFGHGAISNETTILNIRRLLEHLNPTNADVRGPNIGLLKRRP